MTNEEVVRAVRKLCNGKAEGHAGAVAEVKNGGKAVTDRLTEVIQQVRQTGKVPQEWKDATLIPIHKNNYCGISLLSVPGNVLVLVLLERMQELVEPQLLEGQCGFKKGQGTVEQI